ncbi:MAG TPA: ROK family protein [Jatrophihabitantaceae bacterium]|nr:ROK family protein [Jatrophihabitantaceae bacterium]
MTALKTLPVLDVGGTHVAAAMVDVTAWRVVGRPVRLELDSAGSAAQILRTITRAADSLGVEAGAVWGIAMPDPFDYRAGVARFRGVDKFDALDGLDMRAALTSAFATTPEQLLFVNDADAFLLGEWVAGAATGYCRCTGITLGTGVGSSFIADGRIVDSGPLVPPGGRAHRLLVDGKPLEQLMSRRAIRAAYADATGDATADVREIALRARGGSVKAAEVIGGAADPVGYVLGGWMRSFGTELAVVGGAMTGSWDVFGPPLLSGLRRGGYAGQVATARYTGTAPLLGAAYFLAHH